MADNTIVSPPEAGTTSAHVVTMLQPPIGQLHNSVPGVESINSTGENQQAVSTTPSIDRKEAHEEDSNKSGIKSKYWNHFQRFKVNGEWTAKCNYCGSGLRANPKNGTNALKNHLQRCKGFEQFNSKQPTNATCSAKYEKDFDSTDQENSRKDLVKMIIIHEYPLSIVDHIGMVRFVAGLQSTFKCPTRNTIKKDIMEFYENERLNVMKTLDSIGGRVAISAGMCTSNQGSKYMAVTAHYIDNSWKLQSRMLGFIHVPNPHTIDDSDIISEMLTDTVEKILLEWKLGNKLSTITFDNCCLTYNPGDFLLDTVMDSLFVRLDESFILSGHKHCWARMLNVIGKIGLDTAKDAIENIRNSVLYWSATPKRLDTFVSCCTITGVSFTKKLVFDCPTRWNSTYLMLETAQLYRDVFPLLRQMEPHYESHPSSMEWDLAERICAKLKVFYEATKLFSETQYPTANMYFDKFCEIMLAMNEWKDDTNPKIKSMMFDMSVIFNNYWDNIYEIIGFAAILDPRYKMALLKFYYEKLYPLDYRERVVVIRGSFYDLFYDYQRGENCSSVSEPSTQDIITPSDNLVPFDLYVKTKKRARSSYVRTEIDLYLEEDVLPRTFDFDILTWWKINGVKYPILQQIARDIFAIPFSTVTSESAFSTGGRLISPHRSKLKEETIEVLMCSQNWLWASEKDAKPLALDDYVTINNEEDNDEELLVSPA